MTQNPLNSSKMEPNTLSPKKLAANCFTLNSIAQCTDQLEKLLFKRIMNKIKVLQ